MRYLLIGGIALAILAGGGWGVYSWGYEAAVAEMAEAREEAVRDAVAQARREAAKEALRARERARALGRDLEQTRQDLRAKDKRLAEYQASDAGDKACFAPEGEGLDVFNSY